MGCFNFTCWLDVYDSIYCHKRTMIWNRSELYSDSFSILVFSASGSPASHHYEPNMEAYGRICCRHPCFVPFPSS